LEDFIDYQKKTITIKKIQINRLSPFGHLGENTIPLYFEMMMGGASLV